MQVDEVGRVHLVQSVPLLHPEQQTLERMLDGWRNQQLSRGLQFATIDQRIRYVRRFVDHVNEDPWNWNPGMVEEFFGDLRSVKRVAHTTLRGYQSALRAFTTYISHPDYGWDRVCVQLFGTHPAQVFFEWNTAPHVQEYDGRPTKRPYTREELQALFDHADAEVERVSAAGTKGWQAAYRDTTMMKAAYGYGLRFDELRHLQIVDFARNPHAREFNKFGVCKVRYGKSRRSSPFKPRSVLTVFGWTPGVIEDWLANGRGDPGTLDLFTTERAGWCWSPRCCAGCAATARSWSSPTDWIFTPSAARTRRICSKMAGTRGSCSTRWATSTPRPLASISSCPTTSAAAPCGQRWTVLSEQRSGAELRTPYEAHSRLHLAAGRRRPTHPTQHCDGPPPRPRSQPSRRTQPSDR